MGRTSTGREGGTAPGAEDKRVSSRLVRVCRSAPRSAQTWRGRLLGTGRKLNFSGVTSAAPQSLHQPLTVAPGPAQGGPPRARGGCGVHTAGVHACAGPQCCCSNAHTSPAGRSCSAGPRAPAVPREDQQSLGEGCGHQRGHRKPRGLAAWGRNPLSSEMKRSELPKPRLSSPPDTPNPEAPDAPHKFVCFREPVRCQDDQTF